MARTCAVLVVIAACAPDLPGGDEPARAERTYTGPMPLAFGDCAPPSAAFVSGPRPQRFTDEDTELSAGSGDPAAVAPAPARGAAPAIEVATTGVRAPAVTGVRPAAPAARRHPMYRPSTPLVTPGALSVVGALDRAIVRRYLRRYLGRFEYCYARELIARPWLAGGKLKLAFTIAPIGNVDGAVASGIDVAVGACATRAVKAIMFPAPHDEAGVHVEYLLDLTPPPGSPTSPPAWVKPPRPARSRQLFRDDGTFGRPYAPGAHNPLTPRAEQLAACFRADPRRRGAAVITLAFDAAGVVTTSVVEGVPEPVASCVGEALVGMRPDRNPGAVRCPVAYGDTELAEARGLDVRGSVALDGITLAATATLDGGSIPALVGTLEAQRARVLAADGPAIAVHHPLVVRPEDDTPMRAVYSAVASIVAAREDAVLAVPTDDGEWRALRPIAYPIAPVPFNTGARWSPIPPAPRPVPDGDSTVQLSVYLDHAHAIWLGVSRLAELHKLESGPAQLEKLRAALVDHKASSLFVDRADIAIAAAGDLPYRDVAALIDVATDAGFFDWQLTEERALAARPPR